MGKEKYNMLSVSQIFNCSLPDKTLSFTFDDGPGKGGTAEGGPRTLELAEYLAAEGVFATFFMIGNRMNACPDIVRKVHALGHLIGNHTQDHVRLDQMVENHGDAVQQIMDVNTTIRELTGLAAHEPILFRAPWGQWSEEIALCLQNDPRLMSCVGPINWNLPEKIHDWMCWEKGVPVALCADAMLKSTGGGASGIVVMHDHAYEEELARKNRTFDMIQLLIPKLKARGYRFVRLDEIEEIKKAIAEARHASLR